jgi:hypothetical protein
MIAHHDPPRMAAQADPLVARPGDMTTLVVHCSDGRFGNQCDRFIHGPLQQAMYDRLIIPGGAAWLADHPDLPCEAVSARAALQMLVEVHALTRVVLIAHAGCAFYLRKLGVPPERCESRQRADLIAVGRWLRAEMPRLHVSAYYAQHRGRRVEMKRVFGMTDDMAEVRSPPLRLPLGARDFDRPPPRWLPVLAARLGDDG